MRPLGPVGVTAARSTPNSRAVRRTEGPACIPGGGVDSTRRRGTAAGAEGAGAAAGAEAGAGSCCSTSDGGVLTAPVAGGEQQDEAALADLVADLDQDLGHRAGDRGGYVHGGFVGFEGDQRVLGVDLIAGADVHLDDRHNAEVADVGNLDLGRSCHVDRLFPDRVRTLRRARVRSCRGRCRSGRWRPLRPRPERRPRRPARSARRARCSAG